MRESLAKVVSTTQELWFMNLVSDLSIMSRNYLSNLEHRVLISKQVKV